MYIHNLARLFHQTNTPTLLLKLDIAKAFDTVRWDYLLDLLRRKGFPMRWAKILHSSFAQWIPWAPIMHGRGLRQGKPPSPPSILAIDPVHKVMEKAKELDFLAPLSGRSTRLHTYLYADDAAIFIHLSVHDIRHLASILRSFGDVTVLHTRKSQIAPICCSNRTVQDILHVFPTWTTSFPMKYLCLPLALSKLKKVHMQPLLDKCHIRLALWKGKMMTAA